MIYTDGIHLITDGDINELHQFAIRIGLKREWFQSGKKPHYDIITETKLNRALKYGAMPCTPKDIVKILRGPQQKIEMSTIDGLHKYRASVPTLQKLITKYQRK